MMGLLKHVASGRVVVLSAHTLAGRAPICAVHLAHPAASNDHASLSWTGELWLARDLASTNGTFVNDSRIRGGEEAPLRRGDVLRFGSDAERWELTDDRAPAAVARCATNGETLSAEDGLLALPDRESVQVSVVVDSAGRWFVEAADGSRRGLSDGEQLTVAGRTWEIRVPAASPIHRTHKARGTPVTLATLGLRFHVSPDGAHVRIDMIDGVNVTQLEERACFFLLLHLARRRLADAALSADEQGWVHVIDVADALRMDEGRVNTGVFRAREAFAKAGVEDAEGIVQRRPRQLRIGTDRVAEVKG